MKIVFDSEEEKRSFIKTVLCPSMMGFDDVNEDECWRNTLDACILCWENSGIEIEVRSDG